jgi:hypothetical protein
MTPTPCKYDKLSQDCFGKPYCELDLDEQIEIVDLYTLKNE